MSKQTAVEWLLSEIQRLPLEHRVEKSHLYMHALAMEQEQLKEMYLKGIANYDPTFKRKGGEQ